MRSDSAVEHGVNIENAAYAAYAGENAVFFGENGRRRALVGIDAGVAGGVARSPVFEQSVFQNRGDAAAIPIHDRCRDVACNVLGGGMEDVASYVSPVSY